MLEKAFVTEGFSISENTVNKFYESFPLKSIRDIRMPYFLFRFLSYAMFLLQHAKNVAV